MIPILQNEPEVLNVADCARILRLGKNKTYELVKSGRLPSIKIGGRTIVPKVYLVQFLTEEYEKPHMADGRIL